MADVPERQRRPKLILPAVPFLGPMPRGLRESAAAPQSRSHR